MFTGRSGRDRGRGAHMSSRDFLESPPQRAPPAPLTPHTQGPCQATCQISHHCSLRALGLQPDFSGIGCSARKNLLPCVVRPQGDGSWPGEPCTQASRLSGQWILSKELLLLQTKEQGKSRDSDTHSFNLRLPSWPHSLQSTPNISHSCRKRELPPGQALNRSGDRNQA